jgi:hypothetical protein
MSLSARRALSFSGLLAVCEPGNKSFSLIRAVLQPRERKGAYFFTELRAGLATFFAMAYIISVNANITRYVPL